MTGQQLLDTLRHSVKHADPDDKSEFLQVSGLEFDYHGNDITDVKVEGEPIDPDRTYSVANSNFLAAGKLGYDAFGESEWLNGGIPLTTLLKNYLKKFDQSALDAAGTRIRFLSEAF